MDFERKGIKDLHEMLKAKKATVKDLFLFFQNKIKGSNESVNAFIEGYEYEEQPETRHPLSGIPVAVKDNIAFEGRKMSAGSKMLENYQASYNSHIAEIFREIGVPLLGRTNMDEFAMGSSTETSYYGPTKNPLDLSRVPGGSSGGSAAAVASGMAPYALASDTGGSIRQPAAYCGVVGLKPTYGAVSRRGLIAMSSSLDVIGPITQNVEDAEIVFDTIARYDPLDSTSVPHEEREKYQEKNLNNKTIGVPRVFLGREGIAPDVLENFYISLSKMEKAGYRIVDIDLPHLDQSLAVYYILQPAEASSNMARYDGIRFGFSSGSEGDLLDTYIKTRTEGLGKEVKRRIMLGTYVLSSGYHDEYYYKAQELRKLITREIQDVFSSVDIIATPTTPHTAFRFGEKQDPLSMYLEDLFTVPYNLSGNPAISIPSGFDRDHLPYSIHFVAPLFCEKKLFEVGKDFESLVVK